MGPQRDAIAAAGMAAWTWLLRAPTATEVLLATLCWLGCYWLLRRPRAPPGLPPGPAPWPLVGNFAFALLPPPLLKRWAVEVQGDGRGSPTFSPHVFLTGLTKLYGSVFRLFVGSRPLIVLNTFGAVREALVQKAEVFSDRPSVPIVLMITRKKGKGPWGAAAGPGGAALPLTGLAGRWGARRAGGKRGPDGSCSESRRPPDGLPGRFALSERKLLAFVAAVPAFLSNCCELQTEPSARFSPIVCVR